MTAHRPGNSPEDFDIDTVLDDLLKSAVMQALEAADCQQMAARLGGGARLAAAQQGEDVNLKTAASNPMQS